jgi:hypothetical protein
VLHKIPQLRYEKKQLEDASDHTAGDSTGS